MGKFSSEEIERQYNLIKMLLADPEKYRDAINAIKKDIAYMPIELKKKTWGRKYYLMNESQIIFTIIVNFWKLVNSHYRKLTQRV